MTHCHVLSFLLIIMFSAVQRKCFADFQALGCPPGKSVGDKWNELCKKCVCKTNPIGLGLSHKCKDCGAVKVKHKPGCYPQRKDPSKLYPQCCKTEYICKGDPRFSKTKLYSENKYLRNL